MMDRYACRPGEAELIAAGLTVSEAALVESRPGGSSWPGPVTAEERADYAALRERMLQRARGLG